MRPLTRPSQPYSEKEILDRVEQHFVTEKNHRCTDDDGNCIYGRTGCAVGCLLTAEDATILDSYGTLDVTTFKDREPSIYKTYFSDDQLSLLRNLQDTHDVAECENDLVTNLKDVINGYRV